jgi:hypothetical protein
MPGVFAGEPLEPMEFAMYTVGSYLAYLVISIGLTVWVARTLSRNGRVFLIDSFLENERLADSVNQLLVVGFYLINFGYVTLALKYGDKATDAATAIEALSTKIGVVLLVLGVMHFFNLYLFSKLRKRAMIRSQKPPVLPEQYIEPAPQYSH